VHPTEPPSPAKDARSAAWRRLLVGLGVFSALAVSLIGLAQLAPEEPRAPFDSSMVRRLSKEAPEFVLMGNSMVQTRFDERELDRLLSPAKARVVALGGTRTAYWYLALKNVVLPAVKPRRVLLFFRRQELTSYRTGTGGARYDLGRVSRGRDEVLEARLAPPTRQPLERLSYELGRIAPFARLRALAEPWVLAAAHGLTGARRGSARRHQQRALDDVFATDNLRGADIEPAGAPIEKGSFDELVGPSLLPDIVELTERAGVPLTLVRVRTRAAADGRRKQTSYDRALDAYLARRNVELVDMTNEEWERSELYGEGDHIAARFKKKYTKLFVQNLKRIFR
jgi:hypothetical protein